jgi:exopolyphosphatase/guanosine-5'-triphosphate,3'-diphosphate pyrophosphatase
VRAVGTACLRRARDGRAFAERARRETGIAVEILAESEEARLGERAIALAGAGDDALVIDVGGGSTEVACRELALRCSLPIGAVVVTEARAANPPSAEAEWNDVRASIARTVATLPAGCAAGRATWAIGGTAVNLGACAAELARFDPRAVEGVHVTTARVREWADVIGRAPRARRLEFPIEAERADILPAGLAILAGVLEHLGADGVRISALGLRHGLARELLDRDRPDVDPLTSPR